MFYLKLLEINLNTIPKTLVFGIYNCVLIELMYYLFVKDFMVSCLNF